LKKGGEVTKGRKRKSGKYGNSFGKIVKKE
jgi:hypothetical protein